MKTLRMTIAAMMIMLTSLVASAQPMSVYSMRNNARFLTDRMAYTLGLSAAILDDLYCINYDYICGVNDYLDDVALGYRYDDYMEVVYARDYALRRLLTEAQWARLMAIDYFYRPISFLNHHWSFGIYAHDRRMDRFFFDAPRRFDEYRGGTFFGGMRAGRRGEMGPGEMRREMGRNDMNGRMGDQRQGNGYKIGNMRGEVTRQGNMQNNNMRQGNGYQIGNTTRTQAQNQTRTQAQSQMNQTQNQTRTQAQSQTRTQAQSQMNQTQSQTRTQAQSQTRTQAQSQMNRTQATRSSVSTPNRSSVSTQTRSSVSSPARSMGGNAGGAGRTGAGRR